MSVPAFSSVLFPLTHSSSIPPSLIFLHEPQFFSLSLILSLSLSLSSRIFSPPTTSHTPRSPSHSFPSLTVYSHWRSTAPYSFFLFLFSSFFGFWLCSRIQQHRADVLALLLYVAPVKKAGRGLSLQWAEYSNSLVFS